MSLLPTLFHDTSAAEYAGLGLPRRLQKPPLGPAAFKPVDEFEDFTHEIDNRTGEPLPSVRVMGAKDCAIADIKAAIERLDAQDAMPPRWVAVHPDVASEIKDGVRAAGYGLIQMEQLRCGEVGTLDAAFNFSFNEAAGGAQDGLDKMLERAAQQMQAATGILSPRVAVEKTARAMRLLQAERERLAAGLLQEKTASEMRLLPRSLREETERAMREAKDFFAATVHRDY